MISSYHTLMTVCHKPASLLKCQTFGYFYEAEKLSWCDSPIWRKKVYIFIYIYLHFIYVTLIQGR